MLELDEEQRGLFGLVKEAVFSNPFGARRLEVDRRIAGPGAGALSRAEIMQPLMERVDASLEQLESGWRLEDFSARDRMLLEFARLFQLFHRHAYDLDAHIEAQQGQPESNLPLQVGPQLLESLLKVGFAAPRAARMIGLFYQLRRAYYFIDRALIGSSDYMTALRERLWENVFGHDIERFEGQLWDRMEDFSVFLLGETGSGKGTAAAAIGRCGWIPYDPARQRFAANFMAAFLPINLSQFSEGLIESELFGHVRGAFTGAIEDHRGMFARCPKHGSIFLDEIGEVSAQIQIKLLHVLQERRFMPLGSHSQQRFDGRMIAATNRPLEELRGQGRMRDDLFYRLCSDIIEVPPLRLRLSQRPEALFDLIDHILERMLGQPDRALAEEVHARIQQELGAQYPWPGNVRELEQICRRVVLTQRCLPSGLSPQPRRQSGAGAAFIEEVERGLLDAEGLLQGYAAMLYARDPNYSELARRLGLDRRTVKKYVELAQDEALAGGQAQQGGD